MLTVIGAGHVAARRHCISSAAIECRLDSKLNFNQSINPRQCCCSSSASFGVLSTMASSLRLPAGSLLSATRSSQAVSPFGPIGSSTSAKPCQCRYFSQTSISQKGMRGVPQNMTPKQPAQPSMKTRGNQMSRAEMPQDLGLLPGTFIRPLWRDMPSIFQLPRERLQLEWLWIKQGVQNFFG